jgi:hypothetical protein
MWASYVIFKNLPKVKTRPMGQNSPNLVTLDLHSLVKHPHFPKTIGELM